MDARSLVLGASVALSALVLPIEANALEAGDIILRMGAVTIAPDDSSDGVAIPGLGLPELPGTSAEVDTDTQFGLTATYMLSSTVGLELLAATPYSHALTANLVSADLGKIDAGEATHLPPTLSLVWYPLGNSSAKFQPYFGGGVNYTIFFDESVNADLEAAAGALAGLSGPLPLDLELDNSWGLSAQVGVDVVLNHQWHLNAAIRWIDIDTEASFKNQGVEIITVDQVAVDPWVYQLTLGYRF